MAICFLAFWVFVGVTSAATIYVPDDYAKIQWAVDNATTGDIIIVESGTYHENVIVDKQLILRGVDTGFGRPVIDANYLGSPVTLSADGITLEGFEVRHSGEVLGSFDCGIKVWFSNGNVVRNNTIRNNFDGILNWNSNNSTITSNTVINNHHFGITSCVGSSNNIAGNTVANNQGNGIAIHGSSNTITDNDVTSNLGSGLYLSYSSNNTVTGNTVNLNGKGGILLKGPSNTITGNIISNNGGTGMYLYVSSGNNIIGNIVDNNHGYGIRIDNSSNNNIIDNSVSYNSDGGIYLTFVGIATDYGSNCNNITNNIVSSNGYDGIFLEESSSNNIIANTVVNHAHGNGIVLWNSNYNNITSNTVCANNVYGIYLHTHFHNSHSSSNNNITDNIVSNNALGFYLYDSNSNNITGNTVSNNDYEGVYPYKSSGNKIYLNNFINNADNVRSYESTNIWNSTEITKYKYKEEEYKNYLGNYWSDHDCVDRNGDGICDDAYGIDGDWDYRPLVEPFNAPPSVEIATDKDEYEAGDVMRISITLRNPPTGITLEDSPTEERDVVFRWWLEFPDYGLSFSVVETMLTLPVGYERVFTLRWTLPDFGVSFHATWHVALYDAETLGLLSEDTADWWFVGRGARVHQHSFQK